MALNEKEATLVQNLMDQEKLCIQKYTRYEEQAHDSQLRNLFTTLKESEMSHYNALEALKNNETQSPTIMFVDSKNYAPTATYTNNFDPNHKEEDAYLCTDCITTEKSASTDYNEDLFQFSSSNVRETLNQIQTEEQKHAEMIYKYKSANGMA